MYVRAFNEKALLNSSRRKVNPRAFTRTASRSPSTKKDLLRIRLPTASQRKRKARQRPAHQIPTRSSFTEAYLALHNQLGHRESC